MTALELDEVKEITEEFKLDEGTLSAKLDEMLHVFTLLCQKHIDGVKTWAMDVFSGRVEYATLKEKTWLLLLKNLQPRAQRLLTFATFIEPHCYQLDGLEPLQNAMVEVDRLLNHWVTPKLAVSPAGRQVHLRDGIDHDEIRRRLAALVPTDPVQQ